MEIKILKTYEIDDDLWSQITEGFVESFDREVTVDRMKKSFCVHNRGGYGYHAIALSDDGEVMGYNVFSPVFYNNGLKTVVSGSTYVRPKFRTHEMLFMNMVQALRKAVIAEGYKVEVGVPNHNSEKFAIKILKFNYVGELDYYILPFNLSRCLKKPGLHYLDWFMKMLAKTHLLLQSVLASFVNYQEKRVKYELELDDNYWQYRFDSIKYKQYQDGEYKAYWLPYDEDGIRAVYLMDFREGNKRTFRSLLKALREITKTEDVDMILFVGYLHLKQFGLLKCPRRLVPKRLPLTYYVLNKSERDNYVDMQNPQNWNFSLMNFDAR